MANYVFKKNYLFCLVFCLWTWYCHPVHSLFLNPMQLTSKRRRRTISAIFSTTEDKESTTTKTTKTTNAKKTKTTTTTTTTTTLLDWNVTASGTIGSLLIQMQKKEEEMRKLNKTIMDDEQYVILSPEDDTTTTTTTTTATTSSSKEEEQRESSLPPMNKETAKELDEAVRLRFSSAVGSETIPLDLPQLYKVLSMDNYNHDNNKDDDDDDDDNYKDQDNTINLKEQATEQEYQESTLPPLSKPDHYQERIGRDMRRLAVSIASCVDDVSDWREVCQAFQPTGGLAPLIDCIREGASTIRQRKYYNADEISDMAEYTKYEESFVAASSACRALRDLCALNLDLAAVITDGLLRANHPLYNTNNETAPSLLQDLVTLLNYAHDNTERIAKPISRRRKIMETMRRKKIKPRLRVPRRKVRRQTRQRCKLYVTQLLLAMTCASDSAVDAFRNTKGLQEAVLVCSSYARREKTKRWLRYPREIVKNWRSKGSRRRAFIEAASLTDDTNGKIKGTANQILAAMGYNQWVPKQPGQKGLRILSLDGGGSRGMTAVTMVDSLVESLGGLEVSDCFDFIIGTSTGAIIAFLIGLRRETSKKAIERYDELIEKIFIKSAMSTPLMLFTTATYDESPFMEILSDILGEETMLDSRADPSVPFVFGVTSKMSSTPTHVALLRNYNYNGGEHPDPFMVRPEDAREALGLTLDMEDDEIQSNDYAKEPLDVGGAPRMKQPAASRHPGSFRVLQRYALRASTAAPTVFKPVMMGGEMYCDGGIVASNPTAIAIHEARSLFPDIPIECVVSLGTGGFVEQKSAPRIGWDGIIGQIVNSATDAEQIHHILEDILGDGGTAKLGRSKVSDTVYMRFNPVLGLPDEFPIDVTDPEKLEQIKKISREYMSQPEQQHKLKVLKNVIQGRRGLMRWFRR